MADRATVTIFVYDMPPEHEADFFDYLRDIGVEDEYEPDGVNPPEVIGVDHYVPEMVLGGESEVADQLDEWGAVYRVHQDAKYEYDATAVLGAPGLGRFNATCTQSGQILIPSSAVDAAVADSLLDPDGPPLTERLARLTGAAWEQRFAEVTAARQQPPASPPPADLTGAPGDPLAVPTPPPPVPVAPTATGAATATCGKWMPVACARCVLAAGHAGTHRSTR